MGREGAVTYAGTQVAMEWEKEKCQGWGWRKHQNTGRTTENEEGGGGKGPGFSVSFWHELLAQHQY